MRDKIAVIGSLLAIASCQPVPECSANAECAAPKICKSGACTAPTAQKCVDVSDCPGRYDLCSSGICVAPQCLSPADCPGRNDFCDAGTCVTGSGGSGGGGGTGGAGGGTCTTQLIVYRDIDGDGFGSKLDSAALTCAPLSGYVGNNLDCADQDARANPGQMAFLTSPIMGPTSAGSLWDFNCNGTEETQFPTAHAFCNQGPVSCQGAANKWLGEFGAKCGETRTWILACSGSCVLQSSELRAQGCR